MNIVEKSGSAKVIMINCKVCQVETSRKIRCGALVCEACKRFYLRYRSIQKSLHCSDGIGRCLKAQRNRPELTPKGVVWRHMCTACRFHKCLQVGMGRNSGGGANQMPSVDSANSSTGNQDQYHEPMPFEGSETSNLINNTPHFEQQKQMMELLACYILLVSSGH